METARSRQRTSSSHPPFDDTDSLWDLDDLEEGIARREVGTCSSGNSRSRSRTGHRNEATAPPSGNNGAGRRNNPPPSPIVPPHVPAQQAGIFAGIHSVPGDIVDLMTRQGTFTFLERLNESGRLWSLRDFRISRLVPKRAAEHRSWLLHHPCLIRRSNEKLGPRQHKEDPPTDLEEVVGGSRN